MLTLLKNLECYCPEYKGKNDILIAFDRIYRIMPAGKTDDLPVYDRIISCEGMLAFPGLIDQHVHIAGSGGEEGFSSRTGELEAPAVFSAGITTVVGLLGTDGYCRSMESLYAHAGKLESCGLSVYLYSGCYRVPTLSLTGSLVRDMIFIEKIIGAGEIAISDHRCSQPGLHEMLRLSSDVHVGALLSGKAGVVHLHIGDGKDGLGLLKKMLDSSDLPASMFVPTHVNRNAILFDEAAAYWAGGGNIDLTAGETAGLPVPEAIRKLCREKNGLSRVTISSDAGGSFPGGGCAEPAALIKDIISCIKQEVLPPSAAFRLATENPARLLNLYPKKGTLREGSDADILIADRNYNIKMLFSRGRLVYSSKAEKENE
ncbi:MAG: beta-aspartyl-peptidase [Oscillospiraceae bacterium]|jgi:beta-aspartyl-dipeptidase (metallo-type)